MKGNFGLKLEFHFLGRSFRCEWTLFFTLNYTRKTYRKLVWIWWGFGGDLVGIFHLLENFNRIRERVYDII